MIDRLFLATLTFCVSIVGALAIASALFGFDAHTASQRADAAPVRVVQLDRVVITAKRAAATTAVAQGESAARVE